MIRNKIINLLAEVGEHYRQNGIAQYDLHPHHDIHAYYEFNHERGKAVHVQAYPGLSTENEFLIYARLLDYEKVLQERANGTSVGNEHKASLGLATEQVKIFRTEDLVTLLGNRFSAMRIPR